MSVLLMTRNTHKPKIAFLFWTNENFGGAERRYARLAAYLQAANLSNVTLFGKAPFFQALRDLGVTMSTCEIKTYLPQDKTSKTRSMALFLRCLRDIRAGQFEHVHICANPAMVSFLYSVLSPFLPRFSISMNAGLFAENASLLAKKIFAPLSVSKSTSVDCLGPRYKQQFEHYVHPRSRSKLHVAPCSFIGSQEVYPAETRDIDICFAGRFVRGKGLELLESALEGESGLSVHICGNGPIKPDLHNAQVYHSNDIQGVLSRSKIFVSLQREDNYPSQSLLEAMSAGCAIVSTDVGDTRLLLNDDNAILISPDPSELRAAINVLLLNVNLRQRLGEAAKQTLHKEHTIERYAEYIMSAVVKL